MTSVQFLYKVVADNNYVPKKRKIRGNINTKIAKKITPWIEDNAED